jgi:PQQ-like domain
VHAPFFSQRCTRGCVWCGVVAVRPAIFPVGEQKLTPPPADRPKGSFLLAWNPATQKEAWRFPNVNGSTMTTAGNLVFSSSIDGHFMAFSADKGEQLWQAQLVPGFGSPITYSLDGKQYVSVLAGPPAMAVCTPLRLVRILPYRLLRLIAARLQPRLQLERPRRTACSAMHRLREDRPSMRKSARHATWPISVVAAAQFLWPARPSLRHGAAILWMSSMA